MSSEADKGAVKAKLALCMKGLVLAGVLRDRDQSQHV